MPLRRREYSLSSDDESSRSSSRSRSQSRSRSRSRSRSQSRPRARSISRSSTAGPHPRSNTHRKHRNRNHPRFRRPSVKTAAIFVAALAVATVCVHRIWQKRTARSEKDHWENSPGRHSRRRNVVRDRHNGYLDGGGYNHSNRRQLHDRDYRSRGGSRFYDDESDGDPYYSDYCPSPSERTRFPRRERIGDRRGRGLEAEDGAGSAFGGGRDELVRYEKASTARSEAESNRLFDEDTRSRRRFEDTIDDWNRRDARREPSPSDERRPEPIPADRRSRRRSDYY
ncbi:uncharacterized protein CTRU02_214213 [Colletotrichum truncatum]|uniref:Uncharacterized protein n=1 Tax=Colletotrichum truncatum TaxID=5467 RepID=A0ACC3YHX0_COLTU|nr:uncharacterized protein CTRU02_11292 [Colletotrichum truncatum]KAF6786034.1 hypothetical protein CTRU02_11292 [Colletotrichum truncatum]